MEPEGSLPRLQEPATGPHLIQMNVVLPSHPVSLRFISVLSFHLRHGLSHGRFPSGFSTQILHAFLISSKRVTCPAN